MWHYYALLLERLWGWRSGSLKSCVYLFLLLFVLGKATTRIHWKTISTLFSFFTGLKVSSFSGVHLLILHAIPGNSVTHQAPTWTFQFVLVIILNQPKIFFVFGTDGWTPYVPGGSKIMLHATWILQIANCDMGKSECLTYAFENKVSFFYSDRKLRYRGESLQHKPHGWGEYHYRNGSVYTGEWKDGKRDGFGRFWTQPVRTKGEVKQQLYYIG